MIQPEVKPEVKAYFRLDYDKDSKKTLCHNGIYIFLFRRQLGKVGFLGCRDNSMVVGYLFIINIVFIGTNLGVYGRVRSYLVDKRGKFRYSSNGL